MKGNTKRALQQARQEMQQFQHSDAKPGHKPTMSKENYDFLAELFGEHTIKNLSSKAGVGFKDTAAKVEMSEPLYQAIVDELGEEVAKRIVDMLTEADDEQTVTVRSEGGWGVGPGAKDTPDPFWGFARSTDKPRPSPLVSHYTDPFWKAFLNKE